MNKVFGIWGYSYPKYGKDHEEGHFHSAESEGFADLRMKAKVKIPQGGEIARDCCNSFIIKKWVGKDCLHPADAGLLLCPAQASSLRF